MLALLAEQAELAGQPPLRIALAAPTGKAAARLQEAVQLEIGKLARADRARLTGLQAVTLHRLLGCTARTPRPGSGITAAIGCRTTSSSSTRRRWCR